MCFRKGTSDPSRVKENTLIDFICHCIKYTMLRDIVKTHPFLENNKYHHSPRGFFTSGSPS